MVVSPSCPQLLRGKEVFLDEESTRVKSLQYMLVQNLSAFT